MSEAAGTFEVYYTINGDTRDFIDWMFKNMAERFPCPDCKEVKK